MAIGRGARSAAPTGLRSACATVVGAGADGLSAVASHPDVDLVLCASSGTDGLEAVLAAIDAGKTIALANKEVLVMAGALVTEAARRRASRSCPWTASTTPFTSACTAASRRGQADHADRIRRTVSRTHGARDSRGCRPPTRCKHPTWQMGRKITIDSATLMNKGLEVIEAHWLFGLTARSRSTS